MPDTNRRRSSRHLRLLVRATRQIPVSASPPRPGIVVGAAISFGFGAVITAAFRPWGWGVCRFDWGAHVLFIHNAPWRGIWANRAGNVHPYPDWHHWERANRIEGHRLIVRSPMERRAARLGLPRPIEHHHR